MSETTVKVGILRRIEAALGSAIKVLIGVLLAGMVILVFSNVIFRYFLNAAIAWSEEISRFMMIWLSFLGAVIAFIRNEHLGLDILVKAVPKKVVPFMTLLADALTIVAVCMLFLGGWELTKETWSSGWTSPATDTPYGIVYVVVPLCGAILLFQAMIKTVEHIGEIVRASKGGR